MVGAVLGSMILLSVAAFLFLLVACLASFR
jgi:hypothetical protein